MIKKIFKVLGLAFAAVLLAIAAIVLSDPVYWKRLVTAPLDGDVSAVDWYAPVEEMPGAPLRADLSTAQTPSIARSALDEAMAYGSETDSVALLVFHQGQLLLEHYWPGYGPDTRTDPASMHKSILGIGVGLAIEDGFIDSVDAPASRWLTEWQDDARADITVRNLLQMATGLALVPFSPNPFGAYFKFLLGTDITAAALAVPAAEPPGNFAYSNINAELLGVLLQRAVGRRYAEYMNERLWSRINAGPAYVWLDRDNGMARTFCCIQTTARGWLQVGRLILGEGNLDGEQIVPRQWMQALSTPSVANPNYGYQIWLGTQYERERIYNAESAFTAFHSEPFAADDLIYLDGFGGQRLYVSRSHQLVIVRTGRSQMDWDDARLPNLLIRGLTAPVASAPGGEGED